MPFPGSVMSDQVATGLLAGLVVVVVVEGFVPAGRVVVGVPAAAVVGAEDGMPDVVEPDVELAPAHEAAPRTT